MKIQYPDTSLLFYGSRLFCSPLEAIYTLLIFIVSKELNASLLQLTLLASLKPITSIIAFYVTSIASRHSFQARNLLICLNMIGCLPCFMFPFVDNVWYYISSYAVFITTVRVIFPTWNQILKSKVGLHNLAGVISKGTSINYSLLIMIPLIIAHWMDQYPLLWKQLFALFGMFQVVNGIILLKLQSPLDSSVHVVHDSISIKNYLLFPLQAGWKVLNEQTAFSQYLLLFFLGGMGLVMIQPILPLFFKDNLHLSYQDLALAFSFCRGLFIYYDISFMGSMVPSNLPLSF